MRLFALALCILTAPAALAQPTFGLKAGLNVSTFTGLDEDDLDGGDLTSRLGFVGGVFAEVPLSPQFSIRPELLYSQKGARISASDTIEGEAFDIEQDLNVDYVEVPVLARFAVPVSPLLRVGVLAGPSVAFKARESIAVTFNGEEVDPEDLDLGEDLFTSTDIGGVLGADIGSGPFAVDLRYTFGFADIIRNEEEDPDAPTFRNGVFSVTGVFRLGR